jgi:glycosyltransferase involved in cell wall biosynthesis
VRKLLFVIGSLEYGDSARQLTLLVRHLPRADFAVRVIVLGCPSPWVAQLRAAGVFVDVLGWKRPIDPQPILALNQLLREYAADVVHTWDRPALRACVLAGLRGPGRFTASGALPPGRPGLLDGWLLRRAGRVVALGEAEAARYRALGVREERLVVLPPAVEPISEVAPAGPPGLPPEARVLLFVGPVERHRGLHEAVWGMGMLRLVCDDLRLVVVGDGPDRERVQRFAEQTRVADLLHLAGPQDDLAPWLARAEMVLVPPVREAGRSTALEAMAAGKAVVASRLPGLAELIRHEETGLLATPGDTADLSRQVRRLLADRPLAARLGESARRRAASFAPAALAAAVA